MHRNTIKKISSYIYDDYKYQFCIFNDKILSKRQFVCFVDMTFNEYHNGTHAVEIELNGWTLWCYHRYIGITHETTGREQVIETLSGPFFYEDPEYDSFEEVDCDIRCFIELFETAYQGIEE